MKRWLGFVLDRPAETGCYGFVLRIGKLRLSVSWPARES